MRGHGADDLIAHGIEQIVVGHVARADELDARLVEPTLDELLDEGAALPGRHEHEDGIGLGVGGALQERRKVGIGERKADGLEHFSARLGEGVLEGVLGVDARGIVRHHGDDFLDAVLGRPLRHRHRRLRQREAGARDVRRRLGDRGGARGHHQLDRLRLGRERRRRHRRRRHAEARDDVHLVIDEELLGEPLGVVGNGAVVLEQNLDLLAGDRRTMLLHVELDAGIDLLAGRSLRPGHRQDEADLDAVLRERAAGEQRCERQRRDRQSLVSKQHCVFPPSILFVKTPRAGRIPPSSQRGVILRGGCASKRAPCAAGR